ncbi:MAG: BCD family MFS transporter [Caldilineaceae bacterium]|nr:BCD family MFS transporter [Caldilineaceae bacterium]
MNWRRIIRLTMVHIGVSITVVPVTSTLNRIMIADMGMSATLVGILVALPYLLSPLQVLVGNWADRRLLWGLRRSPWILIGGLMAAFGSYFTAHAAYILYARPNLGLALAVIAFVFWGMGVNIASVSYLSLVSDLTEGSEGWRSRAVSVMWTAMILSTITVSIMLSVMLTPYPNVLNAAGEVAVYNAFGLVWLIASVLILFGAARLEPKPDPNIVAHNSADNPVEAYRLLAANPSARRFFVYLLLILISIHAQDVLLEPFGADALGMPPAATSRLTAIWGIGVLLTLTVGLYMLRWLGKKRSAAMGALVTAVAFGLIIVTGLAGSANAFMAAVFLLGLGGGLMTVSNLSLMLDMTVPQAAGLYMGAWGVANFAGQALGNIASGLLRDTTLLLTGNRLFGYAAVFSLEIVGLLISIWLLRRISVTEFRQDAKVRLQTMPLLLKEL